MGFKEDYMSYQQLKANRKVLEKKLENMRNSVAQRQRQLEDFRYIVEKEKHDYDVLEKTSMNQNAMILTLLSIELAVEILSLVV